MGVNRNIFSVEIKEILAVVPQLRAAGETELAKNLCRKCVEYVSVQNNTDLLVLFYGNGVYDALCDEIDAATYIFAAGCLAELYGVILSKIRWARYTAKSSNAAMRSFFEWLAKPNRKPCEKDIDCFKQAIRALTQSDVVDYKYADRLGYLSLIDVVSMVVNGTIRVSNNGELL